MSTEKGQEASAARRYGRAASGTVGLVGSLACSASMMLAALGVGVSAAATGMAGMTGAGGASQGVLGGLLQIGPWLLVVSALLVRARP